MRKIIAFFAFAVLFLLVPQKILAASLVIDSHPAQILESGDFQIDVSVSGAANGTNYIRVDLFKDGTTKYFGETYNGSSWYGGSLGASYFPILVQNSSSSATVQARVGTPSVGDYPGPGAYKMRVRRYTASGNPGSGDTVTSVDVEIVTATSTPTATPTPTPESTSTPTSEPTATPTSESTATPTETATPTAEPTSTPISIPTTTPTPTPSSTPTGLVCRENGRIIVCKNPEVPGFFYMFLKFLTPPKLHCEVKTVEINTGFIHIKYEIPTSCRLI